MDSNNNYDIFFGGYMTQEIEIEYKVLLSKQEYERLAANLPFPNEPTVQTNYYFETNECDLKKHASALRIRHKHNQYTLTLKQPHQNGILETHDHLMENMYKKWLSGNPIPTKNVTKQLNTMNIPVNQLRYFGSLKTMRKSFRANAVTYVIDESIYNGMTDYELEIEAPSHRLAKSAFNGILRQFYISPKQPITKTERFFNTLTS